MFLLQYVQTKFMLDEKLMTSALLNAAYKNCQSLALYYEAFPFLIGISTSLLLGENRFSDSGWLSARQMDWF